MRKQGSCLEKEIMQRTMPGARRRGRPHTAWMDNNFISVLFHIVRAALHGKQEMKCKARLLTSITVDASSEVEM